MPRARPPRRTVRAVLGRSAPLGSVGLASPRRHARAASIRIDPSVTHAARRGLHDSKSIPVTATGCPCRSQVRSGRPAPAPHRRRAPQAEGAGGATQIAPRPAAAYPEGAAPRPPRSAPPGWPPTCARARRMRAKCLMHSTRRTGPPGDCVSDQFKKRLRKTGSCPVFSCVCSIMSDCRQGKTQWVFSPARPTIPDRTVACPPPPYVDKHNNGAKHDRDRR